MASKTMQEEQNAQPESVSPALDTLLTNIALAQATDLARARHYVQAENVLAPWVRTAEPAPTALDLLARIRAQQGRLAEAEAFWTRAAQLDPGNADYAAGLRRIARMQQRSLSYFPSSWAVGLLLLALLVAGSWLVAGKLGQLEGAMKGIAGQTESLEHRIDQVLEAEPTPQPTLAPALADAVRQLLQSDRDLKVFALTVDQIGLAISLSGTVPTIALKQRAETLAKRVGGVSLVDSSGIMVTPPPLTSAVREAIRTDARTAELDIQVEQMGNGVRLAGRVPNVEAKMAVEEVARAVPGVELVDALSVCIEPRFADYVVRTGDTLASIARRFYGDAVLWPIIYRANCEKIVDWDAIQPGLRLRIPLDKDSPTQ